MVRDPSAYSARDEIIERSEDELSAALSIVYRAIDDLRKQRGDMTSSAIDDAIAGLQDTAADLRGAKQSLDLLYHGVAA